VTYATVNVILLDHPRVLRIPKPERAAALGVWLAGLLYTQAHLLDGFVPLEAVEAIATDAVLAHLERVGLITRDENDGVHGFAILRFSENNRTKAQVNSDRAATRKRVRRFRKNRATVTHHVTRYNHEGNGVSNANVPIDTATASAVAEQCVKLTQPPQLENLPPKAEMQAKPANQETGAKRSRGAAIPTAASCELTPWAKRWGIDLDHPEAMGFVDHHQARGTTFKDWAAAWRTWKRKALQFAPRASNGHPLPVDRNVYDGPAVQAERAKRDEMLRKAKAEAVPMPPEAQTALRSIGLLLNHKAGS
jgi:hypothetical protein